MKFNFIHSDFTFGYQMAGYRAIIEICTFQLANNGLVTEISLFLWAYACTWLFSSQKPTFFV